MNSLQARTPSEITFLPDTKTHQHRFDIPSSKGDDTYRVSQRVGSGGWECSCPAWIYARGGRKPCKHLNAMSGLLLQIEGKSAPAAQPLRAAPAAQITDAASAIAAAQQAAVAGLLGQAEREVNDLRAKLNAAEAKLNGLRAAIKAA